MQINKIVPWSLVTADRLMTSNIGSYMEMIYKYKFVFHRNTAWMLIPEWTKHRVTVNLNINLNMIIGERMNLELD
jgi:hypothetical protein